jgi:hypothetical protein
VLAAGLRRFARIFGTVAAATAVGSLVLGLLLGSGVWRSLSVGFYVVGALFIVLAFFLGNRGPVRLRGGPGARPTRVGGLRVATGDETRETRGVAVLLLCLGAGLIALGIVTDSRYPLI